MTYDSNISGTGKGGTIAATFADRSTAQKALSALHDAGFRSVWLGVTHGDALSTTGATVTSESDSGGVMDSLGRFFSGEGGEEQALHRALVSRGLDDTAARRLEATLPAGASIVTVAGENNPSEAIGILQTYGGSVDPSYAASGTVGAALLADASSPEAVVNDAGRLQLREERLLVDKQRVASGEARIRKEVVSEQQSVDVPVFHEELFIQRRPVVEGASTSVSPIGESEEIRIPLSGERVDVSKRTVVTEEIEIGKRKVEGTEHVSDTVRREELRVHDSATQRSDDPRLRG